MNAAEEADRLSELQAGREGRSRRSTICTDRWSSQVLIRRHAGNRQEAIAVSRQNQGAGRHRRAVIS